MKNLKKIIVAAILGFLAFAPPGTMIFIGVLILGFLGKTWFIVGIIGGLTALGVYAYIYRDRILEISFVKKLTRYKRR